MANADTPNGFTPVRHLSGGIIRTEELAIDNATAGAMFTGDLVEALSTGYIKIALATTTQHAGVFAGCKWRDKTTGEWVYSPQWPASQATLSDEDAVGYVYADPNIVFSVQVEGTGAFTDNGSFFDMTATAGNTATGRSRQEMDATGTTYNVVRQLGLVKKPDNNWGANAEVEVMIAIHNYAAAAGVTI